MIGWTEHFPSQRINESKLPKKKKKKRPKNGKKNQKSLLANSSMEIPSSLAAADLVASCLS